MIQRITSVVLVTVLAGCVYPYPQEPYGPSTGGARTSWPALQAGGPRVTTFLKDTPVQAAACMLRNLQAQRTEYNGDTRPLDSRGGIELAIFYGARQLEAVAYITATSQGGSTAEIHVARNPLMSREAFIPAMTQGC